MRLRHGVLGMGAALVALSLLGSGCSSRDKDETEALPAGDPVSIQSSTHPVLTSQKVNLSPLRSATGWPEGYAT